jgi:hypothetical protein
MNLTWYCLYLPRLDSEQVAEALRSLLAAQGYQPYDPFPGGAGTPPGLRAMVRQFVAPVQEGWVRVLGQPHEAILPDLSTQLGTPAFYGWLTGESGGFALFKDGARHDDPSAFEAYLRPEKDAGLLQQAFAGKLPVPVVESGGPLVAALGADALPPEVRQLAQDRGVDSKKADRLVKSLTEGLFGKISRQSEGAEQDEQDQARALVTGAGHDLWNSLPGQRVRAIVSVLNLPANWQHPTWEAVRDAYQVHRLRQRSPRMALMPGDKEAMSAVPDALSYSPVYMGLK